MSDSLQNFAREVDRVVHAKKHWPLLVDVTALLERLLRQENWLDERLTRPVPGRPYSQFLLRLARDHSWSIVAFVWPGGSLTPVHDHETWGVVGVYRGLEAETRFGLEGNRDRGPVSLRVLETTLMRPGDVKTVYPPDDVHQVSNPGKDVAISIHVYGCDIGAHRRHAFDPRTGEVKRFVSGYERPLEG